MNRSRVLSSSDISLIKIIERVIKENWTCNAFSDYGTPVNYTYKDVAERIDRMHCLYRNLGLKQGDKIAVCDKNSSNWAIALLSVLTYGAVVVPVLADFHIEQIENIYEHSEAKLIICSKRVVTESKKIPLSNILSITDFGPFLGTGKAEESEPAYIALQRASDNADSLFLGKYPDGMKPEDVRYFMENPEGLALLSYTSGSTGRSKGVMLPYRSLWSNVMFADEKLGLEERSKVISLLPLAHMYGFSFEFMYEFCIGCHIHFLTKAPSPNVVLQAFAQVKPDIVIAVPLIVEKIVMNNVFPALKKKPISWLIKIPLLRRLIYLKVKKQLIEAFGGRMYEIIVGGAAFNKEVEAFLKKIKFPFTVGYGMTECGPIIAYEDWHHFVQGTCGKGVPRMEVKVLSPNPANVPGEIVCRGMNVMLGYYKNPEATAETIDAEGWLHTGDLATMDRRGNFSIKGRQKSVLLGPNGQNIYPEEIEDKIHSITVFEESVVVQRDGKLVALVYISDAMLETKELTRDELMNNLEVYRSQINKELPAFSRISSFEVRKEEFEKTPKRNIKRYLYS